MEGLGDSIAAAFKWLIGIIVVLAIAVIVLLAVIVL